MLSTNRTPWVWWWNGLGESFKWHWPSVMEWFYDQSSALWLKPVLHRLGGSIDIQIFYLTCNEETAGRWGHRVLHSSLFIIVPHRSKAVHRLSTHANSGQESVCWALCLCREPTTHNFATYLSAIFGPLQLKCFKKYIRFSLSGSATAKNFY